jgi:hypothetical protein
MLAHRLDKEVGIIGEPKQRAIEVVHVAFALQIKNVKEIEQRKREDSAGLLPCCR